MRTILFAIVLVGVLIACKNNEVVFKPTCSNFILEKVDWTYCRLHNNIYPIKCNNNDDTLTVRILKHLENYTGLITTYDCGGWYINVTNTSIFEYKEDGRRYSFNLLAPYNLPQCFKKEGLKVKFSGDLRPSYGLDESCGEAFEITKIEEIP